MKRKQKDYIKSQIFYSRTYRRLKIHYPSMLIYFLLCVIPCLIAYTYKFTEISRLITDGAMTLLSSIIPISELGISYAEVSPYFGGIYSLTLPSKMPSFTLIILNIFITLILIMIFSLAKNDIKPISIYFNIILLIHLSSCIFFLLASRFFPYTASEYSELYMKQQIGIWVAFFVITGIIIGSSGNSGILKYITTFIIIGYSFVFGALRYIVFLFILSKGTLLYMAVLFFILGPLFDFLYFVYFYSLFAKRLIARYDDKKRRSQWLWT